MRAVVTRVSHASVTIQGRVNGHIGRGYLVLLGVGPGDTEDTALRLADLATDTRTLRAAQKEAAAILAADPALALPQHALLAGQVERMFRRAGAMN